MDVLYVGSLAIFAALTFALIAGCERLSRVKQVSSHGIAIPQPTATIPSDKPQGERS